jgi:polyisoprenoid-binding protein YceI
METATTTARKTKWVLDPAHSEISFKVKHLMITNVKGEFKKFNADVTTIGDDPSTATVHAVIDTDSISTNDQSRDKHLRSADFFDVEKHEKIVFEGTSFKKIKGDHYELTGILTMKGIIKEVEFDAEFGGINKDPWGNQKAGFSISGKINRKDWGLNWNAVLETGGVLVSDEVKISGEVQFIRKSDDY